MREKKIQAIYDQIEQRAGSVTCAGEQLPQITLFDLSGGTCALSTLWQSSPALLVTGSITCGQTRRWIDVLQALHETYSEQINVAMLYTLEAHPIDVPSPYFPKIWRTQKNKVAGIHHRQSSTFDERLELARQFIESHNLSVPIFLDGMDNHGWTTLGQGPNVAVLVKPDGIIAHKQGWFKPEEMESAIKALLT